MHHHTCDGSTKKKKVEKILEKIRAENFPNLLKNNVQTQQSQITEFQVGQLQKDL